MSEPNQPSESDDSAASESVIGDIEGMQTGLQTFFGALLTGVAVMAIIGIVLADFLDPRYGIPPIFIGLAIGLVTGAVVTTLLNEAGNRFEWFKITTITSAVIAFTIVFLVVFALIDWLTQLEFSRRVLAASVFGLAILLVRGLLTR